MFLHIRTISRLFARTQQNSLVKQLRSRLLFAVSLLICMLFVFSLISVGIVVTQYTLSQEKATLDADINGILNAMLDQATSIRGFISTNTPASLELFTSGRLTYLVYVQHLKQIINNNAFKATSTALMQVEKAGNDWYNHYALVQIQNMQAGHFAIARSDQTTLISRNLFNNFRTAETQLERISDQDLSRLHLRINIADVIAFGLSFGLSVTAIIILRQTFKRLAIPLQTQLETLKETTHQLTVGENEARVPARDWSRPRSDQAPRRSPGRHHRRAKHPRPRQHLHRRATLCNREC